jgi:phosphocarrier protein HPr
MSEAELIQRQVKVTPENGLHLSPISQLVRTATSYSSSIVLTFAERRADAKSAFDLMLLAAPCGAILMLEVTGEDAEAAADSICGLFEKGFALPGETSNH